MKKLTFLLFVFSLSAYISERIGWDCSWIGTAQARTCAVANGDAQRVVDVTTTSASGVVTSASALFVCPGDAGKTVILVTASGSNLLAVNTTTISGCTNTTTVTLANNANATTTNSMMMWATGDSTAAITTQVTNCKSPAASTWPGSGAFPSGVFAGTSAGQVTMSGGYIVSGCVYNVNHNGGPLPALVGSGRYNTVMFLAPTLTACAGNPAQLIYANGQGATFQGIGIEANNVLQNTANGLVSLSSPGQMIIQDFEIRNYGNANAAGTTLAIASGQYSMLNQITVQNGPTGAFQYQCSFTLSATVMNDVFCSNGYRNVFWASGASRLPNAVGTVWIGGGADECSDPLAWCMFVNDNAELQAIGTVIFGTLRVQPGAVAYITDANVGQFTSANRTVGANIAATGKVYSTGTTWRGNAGSASVYNLGTFVDMLGNDYKTCTNNSCTSRTAGQAFTGNLPVTR